MKKFLVVLLVLGLANFASATMSFDLVPTSGPHGLDPGDPLLPSEWIEFDIVYSGGDPGTGRRKVRTPTGSMLVNGEARRRDGKCNRE